MHAHVLLTHMQSSLESEATNQKADHWLTVQVGVKKKIPTVHFCSLVGLQGNQWKVYPTCCVLYLSIYTRTYGKCFCFAYICRVSVSLILY